MTVKKVILTITSVIATAAVAAGIFAGVNGTKSEAVGETETKAVITVSQTSEADKIIGKPDYDALKETAEKCGDDVYYIFNEESGELFIFGTGAMDNCTHLNFAPWAELDVTSVRIADGVTTIGEGAFQYLSNLKSIYIPDSVTMIMYNAFCDCENLTSINIPESVTYIGGGAFAGCTSLKGITLPQSLTTINMETFSYCTNLETVVLPEKLVSIEPYAFSSCTSLTSITLPENLRWIREFAFYDCSSLKEIYIPKNIMGIETMAFGGLESGVEKITVDKNNLYYSSDSFGVLFDKDRTAVYQYPVASKNTSYTIPDSVTIICEYAFAFNKNLSTISIPDSVGYISDFAFAGLSDVSEISIPDSVYYVGHLAFSHKLSPEKELDIHVDNTRLYVLKNWNSSWSDDNTNVSYRFF